MGEFPWEQDAEEQQAGEQQAEASAEAEASVGQGDPAQVDFLMEPILADAATDGLSDSVHTDAFDAAESVAMNDASAALFDDRPEASDDLTLEESTQSADATAIPPQPKPEPQPEPPRDLPARSEAPRGKIARKEYYSIGEVSDLVGLPAHVLRYWESQFPVLNPSKNRSGNRAYQRKEIRLILLVKQLLYEDKYTVEGAKSRLDQLRKGGQLASEAGVALDRELLGLLRQDMVALRRVLTGPRT